MNNLDEEWRVVDTEDMSVEDIMEFMKQNFTFSINLNSLDPKTQHWIKNNSAKILPRDHGK